MSQQLGHQYCISITEAGQKKHRTIITGRQKYAEIHMRCIALWVI